MLNRGSARRLLKTIVANIDSYSHRKACRKEEIVENTKSQEVKMWNSSLQKSIDFLKPFMVFIKSNNFKFEESLLWFLRILKDLTGIWVTFWLFWSGRPQALFYLVGSAAGQERERTNGATARRGCTVYWRATRRAGGRSCQTQASNSLSLSLSLFFSLFFCLALAGRRSRPASEASPAEAEGRSQALE